jgi:hypothetical protein
MAAPTPEAYRRPVGLSTWLTGVRRFAIRVTVMSFAFTLVMTVALALVQEALSGGRRASAAVYGISLPLPVQESTAGLTFTFILAVLVWAVVLSVSQLAIARQVRSYLMAFSDGASGSHRSAQQLMSERLLVEALLALLSAGARVAALTAVLAFLLPRLAGVGLGASLAIAALLCLVRYRKAHAMQAQFSLATRRHRKESNGESARGYVNAIYFRDSYMYRMPVLEVLLLVGLTVSLLALPIWYEGIPAGGASLLLILVWLQGTLRVVTEAGVLGWRWGQRSESDGIFDDDWDD